MSYNVRLFNLYEWLPKEDVPEQISKLIDEKTRIFYAYKNIRQMKKNTTKFPFSFIKIRRRKNKYGQAFFSNYSIINQSIIEFPNSSNNVIYVDLLKQKRHY